MIIKKNNFAAAASGWNKITGACIQKSLQFEAKNIYTYFDIIFKKYCCYLHYYNGTCYIFKSSGRASIINFLDYLVTFEKNLGHGLIPPSINPKTPYHNRIYCCVYKIICLCV